MQHDPSISLCWVLRGAASSEREKMNANQFLTAQLLDAWFSPPSFHELPSPSAGTAGSRAMGLAAAHPRGAGATLALGGCRPGPANFTPANHRC